MGSKRRDIFSSSGRWRAQMIKLETAHIEEFRGIRNPDIEFDPNGSGKSGVIDAIQFGPTRQIGRLTGAGTKSLSMLEHGPHVDKITFPAAAFVGPGSGAWRMAGHGVAVNFTIVDGTSVAAYARVVRVPKRPDSASFALLTDDDEHRGVLVLDSLETAQREQAIIHHVAPTDFTFASAGQPERGKPPCYRVQGPAFLVEFEKMRKLAPRSLEKAKHIHTVWRDPDNDFGDDLPLNHHLQEHLAYVTSRP